MIKLFTKAKHWQIFILLIIALCNYSFEGEPTITIIVNHLGGLFYIGYFLILAISIEKVSSIKLNYKLFYINWFLIVVGIMLALILFGEKKHEITGFLVIPFFYILFALFHVFTFPAKALKSLELEREATFKEYILLSLSMYFLPIGIWWIQPKINKLYNK